MARSAFGGGGDYSALFGSLYAQSKSLKAQQQDALDKDAYDRWKNGLMSDDEWLTYIQGRVDGTASDKDPGDHQHWIELQRQYITAIADSQAEFAYGEGQASIGELIAYYTGRLGRLQEESEEYRDVKKHLNDLVDKRDSDDLSNGAQEIAAQIDRGKATYEDLLHFYQGHLKGLRAGSELYKQVASEITKVRGTIADSKLAGQFEKLQYLYESKKISGGAYANKLTAMAQQYKASDPAKYYQILQAANRIRQSGGSGGGGGGGGGGTGSLSNKQRSHEDQLLNIDSYLEGFTDAYEHGARVVPDPAHPGKQIVLTPELMSEIDHQRLANYDKLAVLYKHAGDKSKYGSILEKKTKYIVNVVQPNNTVDAAKQWGQLIGGLQNTIQANADNADPEQTLKAVVTSFQSMQKWLQGEVVKNGKLVNAEDQPTGDFIVNGSAFVDQALAILSDPELDSATRMQQLDDLGRSLDTDSGADYDRGTKSAMQSALHSAGLISSVTFDLATGKKVMAITENGFEPVDVRVQHTLAVDPNTGAQVDMELTVPDLPTGNGQRVQEVWVDRGGTPTKVYAVTGQAPSGYQVWVAARHISFAGQTFKKGAVIPSDLISSPDFRSALNARAVARQDAFAATGAPLNYLQVPAYDDNGKHHAAVTWYQDPQTHLWYQGKPPISSASLNDDGTLKIGADGKLAVNFTPFANMSGVAAPYIGSNNRAMQSLYDQGAVGTDPRYNQPTGYRDITGQFTADPEQSVTTKTPYYDPHDESERIFQASRQAGAAVKVDDSAAQGVNTAYFGSPVARAMREQAAKDKANAGTTANPQQTFDRLATMAKTMGVTLGIIGPAQKQPGVGSPLPGLVGRKANGDQSSLPRIDLPHSAYSKSSGPALANLPGGRAGAIDASKIQPLPAPKKRPADGGDSDNKLPGILDTYDPSKNTYAGAPTTQISRRGGQQEFN